MARKADDAADEAVQEHPGVPDSQWDAEHPPAEVTEQEERELAARMPHEEAAEAEDGADPSDEAADAPAEG